MNIKLNKPIPLKMCCVNEEYEIDDTEELLREAYEYIGFQSCSNGVHTKYSALVLKAERWLKDNN